jgi:hypothetical protein
MRELWTAGTFSDRPDLGRTGLQAFVDFNVAMAVLNTGRLEPDPGGVGTAPCRDEDVAPRTDQLGGPDRRLSRSKFRFC